jgi:hypothetical protein
MWTILAGVVIAVPFAVGAQETARPPTDAPCLAARVEGLTTRVSADEKCPMGLMRIAS